MDPHQVGIDDPGMPGHRRDPGNLVGAGVRRVRIAEVVWRTDAILEVVEADRQPMPVADGVIDAHIDAIDIEDIGGR
jgi:hypothetical protein